MTKKQKEIKNLTADTIVEFYNKMENWSINDIVAFENKRLEIYEQDLDYYDDNLAGFDDAGFGNWRLHTRNCDSWGGLDNAICEYMNLSYIKKTEDIDEIAEDEKVRFLYPCDDDHVIFNESLFLETIAKKRYKIDNNNNLSKVA